jgi:hypothetical protein
LESGEAWRVGIVKDKTGKVTFSVTPMNTLSTERKLCMVEEDGVAKVFLRCDDSSPIEARFLTTYMCDRFRPLDHASLRDRQGNPRYREVRELKGFKE